MFVVYGVVFRFVKGVKYVGFFFYFWEVYNFIGIKMYIYGKKGFN